MLGNPLVVAPFSLILHMFLLLLLLLLLNQARAWFLKIDPVRIVSMRVRVCVCVCVCVCVRARGY